MRMTKSKAWTLIAIVALTAALVSGVALAAKGGGNGGGNGGGGNGGGNGNGNGGGPTCTQCAPEIDLGNGVVCTLEACGSDCVYSCPLP